MSLDQLDSFLTVFTHAAAATAPRQARRSHVEGSKKSHLDKFLRTFRKSAKAVACAAAAVAAAAAAAGESVAAPDATATGEVAFGQRGRSSLLRVAHSAAAASSSIAEEVVARKRPCSHQVNSADAIPRAYADAIPTSNEVPGYAHLIVSCNFSFVQKLDRSV